MTIYGSQPPVAYARPCTEVTQSHGKQGVNTVVAVNIIGCQHQREVSKDI